MCTAAQYQDKKVGAMSLLLTCILWGFKKPKEIAILSQQELPILQIW